MSAKRQLSYSVPQRRPPWGPFQSNRWRFIFLLVVFNTLLIAVVLLGLRNQEIQREIRVLEVLNRQFLERIATVQVERLKVVYITATFTPTPLPPPATATATPTPTSPPPPPTATPTPSPSPTLLPPTDTPTPTPTILSPTSTFTPTPSSTPSPTITPTPTSTDTPLPIPPPTDTPTPTRILPTPCPEPASIRLSVAPPSLVADGASTATVTALVVDQDGNPVCDGVAVRFATTLGTIAPVSTRTRGGRATAVLTAASVVGQARVTAISASIEGEIIVPMEPGPPARLSISPPQAIVPADYTIAYTSEAFDAYGHSIGDVTASTAFTISPAAGGSWIGNVYDPQVAGVWTVQGTYDGVTDTAILTVTPGALHHFVFSPIADQIVRVSFPITITATDIDGNLVSYPGTVVLTDSTGTIVPTVSGNFVGGRWSGQVRINTVQTEVVITAAASTAPAILGTSNPFMVANQALDQALVWTYGPDSPGTNGDNDYVQVIFFELPDTLPPTTGLYFNVFDPDCGGSEDYEWQGFNTTTGFGVYGGPGAYTSPLARSPVFTPGVNYEGVTTGTLLVSRTFGISPTLDGQWISLNAAPIALNAGEHVDGRYVFKLSVEGVSGDDGNFYDVAVSTSPAPTNTVPAGTRIFAYSWTFQQPPPDNKTPPHLFPYVENGVTQVIQHNFDIDFADGYMYLVTPAGRVTSTAKLSHDGDWDSSSHAVLPGESGATWTVWLEISSTAFTNCVSLYFTDQNGVALPIFTRSTSGRGAPSPGMSQSPLEWPEHSLGSAGRNSSPQASSRPAFCASLQCVHLAGHKSQRSSPLPTSSLPASFPRRVGRFPHE